MYYVETLYTFELFKSLGFNILIFIYTLQALNVIYSVKHFTIKIHMHDVFNYKHLNPNNELFIATHSSLYSMCKKLLGTITFLHIKVHYLT